MKGGEGVKGGEEGEGRGGGGEWGESPSYSQLTSQCCV